MLATKVKKNYEETAESGQFWRSTMLDIDTRLRVARGIAKTETEASVKVFETLKERGHPEAPPPTVSDGWGGIREAMVKSLTIPVKGDLQARNNPKLGGNICKWSKNVTMAGWSALNYGSFMEMKQKCYSYWVSAPPISNEPI